MISSFHAAFGLRQRDKSAKDYKTRCSSLRSLIFFPNIKFCFFSSYTSTKLSDNDYFYG